MAIGIFHSVIDQCKQNAGIARETIKTIDFMNVAVHFGLAFQLISLPSTADITVSMSPLESKLNKTKILREENEG